MKDKLRELAERWRYDDGQETLYVMGRRDGYHTCARELLALLDAEGDGGAVEHPELRIGAPAWPGQREGKAPPEGWARLSVNNLAELSHPARSGVVIDEEMNRCERLLTACTCHADFKDRDMVDPQCCACELGDEVIDTFRAMRTTIQGERHER